MLNFETLFLFVFILSVLHLIKNMSKFMGALLSNPPKRYVVDSRELTLLGFSISYILTFIIKNFI